MDFVRVTGLSCRRRLMVFTIRLLLRLLVLLLQREKYANFVFVFVSVFVFFLNLKGWRVTGLFLNLPGVVDAMLHHVDLVDSVDYEHDVAVTINCKHIEIRNGKVKINQKK